MTALRFHTRGEQQKCTASLRAKRTEEYKGEKWDHKKEKNRSRLLRQAMVAEVSSFNSQETPRGDEEEKDEAEEEKEEDEDNFKWPAFASILKMR